MGGGPLHEKSITLRLALSDNIADISKPLEKKEFLKLRAKLLNEVRDS